MSSEGLMVSTGNANLKLTEAVVKRLGISLGRALIGRFSDGEVQVEIQENVRGKHVLILRSICAPTNDNLTELMVMVDVFKRASARRITVAILYSGYARQDHHPRSARMAIMVKVAASMLEVAGVERVLTMDLHADQIQGFSDTPVDNIYASLVLPEDPHKKNYEDLLAVSPDVGGVARARTPAKQFDMDLAIINKRRPKADVAEVMNVIGEVDGRNCVIADDMIDTSGMLCKAAQVLKERGAKQVFLYCTRPVLSGGAAARIADSALNEVVVTDTIPLREDAIKCGEIRQLSTTPLPAEAFTRIVRGDSIMSLSAE